MPSRVMSLFSDLLYILPITLISLTFHEFAHGFVAYKLGDPTARDAGRLSLNPLRHIDPVGMLLMIVLRFGWAKPVPVNPMYFKNPKKGMMLTALAGPLSNLGLALLSSFFSVFTMYAYYYTSSTAARVIYTFFLLMAMLNIGLAVFNLIPVYPMDGSRILGYFMPDSFNSFFVRYGNYIYIAFFVLVLVTDVVSDAVYFVQTSLYSVFEMIWRYPAYFAASFFFA